MVAVGASPYSLELIRRTRQLAYTLDVGWLAVSIEPGQPLQTEDQRQLDKNLALARELGAEVIFTRDDDMARALLRLAHENGVTQIVVGKPLGSGRRGWLRSGSLIDHLLGAEPAIDLHVISPLPGTAVKKFSGPPVTITWADYGRAGGGACW